MIQAAAGRKPVGLENPIAFPYFWPIKMSGTLSTPIQVLREYWGYEQFRPQQEAIIKSVLDGMDTLALLPTGGGKSVCFQVPALCREGICIVVSPLIALMKDQVHQLNARNIPAVAVHSGLAYPELDRLLDNCVYGKVKFLYLSPERLRTELAVERIKRMNVNLLAVDEAHCISQWGYDFRPSYLEIAAIREYLPEVPVLALTATATREVIDDIQERLHFPRPNVFRRSFARENLAYVVRHTENKTEKLLEIVGKIKGSAVVYVRNRRKTREIALLLKKHGHSADYYHGGLEMETRDAKQDAWIRNQVRIMVCTNAFGMGIDKPNVRLVVHLDLPDSLEAYFQEAGRAGRDGKKAFAVLLYNASDASNLEYQYKIGFPEIPYIKRVYRALGSYYQLAVGAGAGNSYDFDLIDFCHTYELKPAEAFSALHVLTQEGWIELTEAVFTPSSLKIIAPKDTLYDYQLKNPRLDKIIKSILRTYQGAFIHHIHLREAKLAKFLRISTRELTAGLEALQRDHMIDYIPQKDQPQLIFVRERVDADNLAIDHKLYHFRKERHRYRIDRAVAYAEDPVCRSRQLLLYFNEKDPKTCGICDVCLEQKQTPATPDEIQRYTEKIRMILRHEALTLQELLDSFSSRQHASVMETLEYLLAEELITQEDQRLKWK